MSNLVVFYSVVLLISSLEINLSINCLKMISSFDSTLRRKSGDVTDRICYQAPGVQRGDLFIMQPMCTISDTRTHVDRYTYTRDQLFSLRKSKSKKFVHVLSEVGLLRYRGSRGGRRRKCRISTPRFNWSPTDGLVHKITVVTGCRQIRRPEVRSISSRPRILLHLKESRDPPPPDIHIHRSDFRPPNLYVLNPTSLAKPHALQNLQADIASNNTEIAIISESWLKMHHRDESFELPGFNLFRRDRRRRRGGGVAIYANSLFPGNILDTSDLFGDEIELMWVSFDIRGRRVIVGALYHPPRPIYSPGEMLHAIELSIDRFMSESGEALIILLVILIRSPTLTCYQRVCLMSTTGLHMKVTVWIVYIHRNMYMNIADPLCRLCQPNIKLWLVNPRFSLPWEEKTDLVTHSDPDRRNWTLPSSHNWGLKTGMIWSKFKTYKMHTMFLILEQTTC